MTRLPSVLGLAAALALVCCASMRPSYTIEIWNSTGESVKEVEVYWEGFQTGGGSMTRLGRAGHEFIDVPLPRQATVSWRTRDGVTVKREVEIPEGLPRNFKGTLVFELFQDGQVEVRVEP